MFSFMAGAAQPGIQFENGAAGTIWNASNAFHIDD
jgi:hypothetical protein